MIDGIRILCILIGFFIICKIDSVIVNLGTGYNMMSCPTNGTFMDIPLSYVP